MKTYYLGYEDLTPKASILRKLLHLRQFHTSPWAQVRPIARALPNDVVLEVHSHPTNVLFVQNADQMREELSKLLAAEGHRMNLKLCDIQTINSEGG